MDSSSTPSSILDTLRTVEFRLGIKGYNVDEVDEYLDRAAQEAEALQENLRQLNERLRQAGDRIVELEKEARDSANQVAPAPTTAAVPTPTPAPVPAPVVAVADNAPSDETLQRTLLLAQKFVDQVKRESEAEAAATLAQAEATARATVADAHQTAKTLEYESQRQVREEVARLEATRTELATDVESMARHLESERNRLRDALSEILSWVDENVQPANSLMGGRPKTSSSPKPAAPAAIAATPAQGNGGGEADSEPTLNLKSVADATQSGSPHSI
jgi:DivIVA domain-containing protein